MLGTAMKVAGHMSGIPEVLETAKPAVKTGVWLNAHIAGPFLGSNGAFKIGLGDYESWKVEFGKIGFAFGSYVGNGVVNGLDLTNMGETLRSLTMMTGSGMLGIYAAGKNAESNLANAGLQRYLPYLRTMTIGCYTVAGVSYAYSKFTGK